MMHVYHCFARRVKNFGNFAVTHGDEVKSLITLPRSTVHGVVFDVLFGRPANAATTAPRSHGSGALHAKGGQLCERRAMKMS
ncbi:hypothetical protein ABIA03_006127 [Bradyrhizobium yuanmingense]|uniref:Uncharacterized protein n=1 Tax=Bradyrhizobium yuanmingense TaxID=108015 RepID=A0ABV4G8X7_9BRAD